MPRLRFVLDDIGREGDDVLRARAMTALGRLVLYCFRHARDPGELIRGLSKCWDLVAEVYTAPNGLTALGTVWRYILCIHDGPPEVVLTQLALVTPDPFKETVMTAGEALVERGHVKGVEDGERRMFLKMLSARFGSLPASVVALVSAADQPQLDAWLTRAVTASTLDAVFAA